MHVDDLPVWLEAVGLTGEFKGAQLKCKCPFHEDDTPSCSVDTEKQVFFCHGCDAKGDAVTLLAAAQKTTRAAVIKQLGLHTGDRKRLISQKLVFEWHELLLKSPKYLGELQKKGVSIAAVRDFQLGLYKERVSIPVVDKVGDFVNVRLWSPTDRKRKVINLSGYGNTTLFALQTLEGQTRVYITEGELKTILLNSLGFPTVCGTGGASTWKNDWASLFADKEVVLVYDIDKPGRAGADKAARSLYPYARAIYDLALPISKQEFPQGDVTDYFVGLNNSPESFLEAVKRLPQWEPKALLDERDETLYDVLLHRASEAKYTGKFVKTEAVVSAKDMAPFILPCKVEIVCAKEHDYCSLCPVYQAKDAEPVFELDNKSPVLLELAGAPKDKLEFALRNALNIPRVCKSAQVKAKQSLNVEELRLIPQLGISNDETEHVVRRAFYVGHGIETNIPYTFQARVLPEPKSQHATLLVYDAQATTDSLTDFELSTERLKTLEVFKPVEWTVEALTAKLENIYADLEANITRIYQRTNLHLFYDLVYHSALRFKFSGKVIKGWIEGLVLGDSGQGKSETVRALLGHYRLGEVVDSKGASAVGLIGGLQESGGRWFVTWGVITLQDRRLVVLEEVKGMSQEVIARLTEVRSSGIATVAKVEKAKAHARTRLVWISNPRSDRPMLSYNFGVEAIKELIGSLEDIRRFDMAITVASGEVDREVVNLSEADRPQAKHVYTSELCQALVLWTWSRATDEIIFEEQAVIDILAAAKRMGQKYTAQIPLVELADQRLKLARLSVALAARTFSTDDGHRIIVRPCHVAYIESYLDGLYSATSCGYARYSELCTQAGKMHDEEEVKEVLLKLPYTKDTLRGLLETNAVTLQAVRDLTSLDREMCQEAVGVLVRKNALKRHRSYYVKTPAMIEMLKGLLENGTLENQPSYTEEF